jgi:hypothetical protein
MTPLTIVPVTIIVMGTVAVCFEILMAHHFVGKPTKTRKPVKRHDNKPL